MSGGALKLAGIVGMLMAAGALVAWRFWPGEETGEELWQPTYWICGNEGCGYEWETELGEVKDDIYHGEGVHCPECGSDLVIRAYICHHCGGVYRPGPHGYMPTNCPECGAKFHEPLIIDGKVVEHTHGPDGSHPPPPGQDGGGG